MDDPNITMEEYIRLKTENAQKHDFEADFPTIVYNDALTSNENVLSKPTISFHEGGLLIFIIKNLWVPFGIPFDPKWYYKDGVYTRILRRPRLRVHRGQYRSTGPGFCQRNNKHSSYPDRRQTVEESLTKFMAESAKRHEENSNIIKEIELPPMQLLEIKELNLMETNPRDHVKSILTAKVDSTGIRRIGLGPYTVSDSHNSNIFSETVPFPRRLHDYCCDGWKEAPLVDLGESVSVMPLSTYTNLGLGDLAHTRLTVELADRMIKHPRGIAKNVLVRIGKFVFPIDFIILDIPEDDDVPLMSRAPPLPFFLANPGPPRAPPIDPFQDKNASKRFGHWFVYPSQLCLVIMATWQISISGRGIYLAGTFMVLDPEAILSK
ncbi:ribonuclease H-like domain, reverse transcriptase, RNA-dependent DNA polymerase [Tanacetum coccineum]